MTWTKISNSKGLELKVETHRLLQKVYVKSLEKKGFINIRSIFFNCSVQVEISGIKHCNNEEELKRSQDEIKFSFEKIKSRYKDGYQKYEIKVI